VIIATTTKFPGGPEEVRQDLALRTFRSAAARRYRVVCVDDRTRCLRAFKAYLLAR
jgi:hypothetical protein